ncbi:protein MALE DISCOVERER 2-like [Bidens hawaiensis]|uniref:protein MALE DISCOVERER 2-like n=1 Tax=Bidens hawaiensis TaxID=980011 RepID=UPI00404986A0
MGVRWKTNKIQYSLFLILILVIVHGCSSLNLEGLALLDFQARVSHDPNGAFKSWNIDDPDPCSWSHVNCVFGRVHALDLKGLSLEGVLAPELGNLIHLRRLILSHNHFSGVIPKELGQLIGNIPPEIRKLQSLNFLLLYDNDLGGNLSVKVENFNFLYKFLFVPNFSFNVKDVIGFLNKKLGRSIWQGNFDHIRNEDSILNPFKETTISYHKPFQLFSKGISHNSYVNEEIVQNLHIDRSFINRKLVEQPENMLSRSFPSIRIEINKLEDADAPSSDDTDSDSGDVVHVNTNTWLIMVGVSCGVFFLFSALALWFTIRNPVVKTMAPWKSALSGQLQKAFVTGVQKLDLGELETACEEFSNIIDTINGCVLYKGILPNGVEICVASTTITTLKDWSNRADVAFHKKIETFSRVNHKNFVNLIGYCAEQQPFVRMMVFEYAPAGTLSEHLHVHELEHLDWKSRIRIIMGVAYCLQCMHDLDPPVVHKHLDPNMIYLTDDYAAKIADLNFWKEFYPKAKKSKSNESLHSPHDDKETDIYHFGVLLLEIITEKHQNPDKLEPLVTWAEQFLKKKENISHIIDPTLKSFKQDELEIVCEVIQECIKKDGSQRPSLNEIIPKLREVLRVSPEQAIPRLSPLWWAELELLSIKEGTT